MCIGGMGSAILSQRWSVNALGTTPMLTRSVDRAETRMFEACCRGPLERSPQFRGRVSEVRAPHAPAAVGSELTVARAVADRRVHCARTRWHNELWP